MRDLHSNIDVRRVISPVSVADNTPQVGQIIDKAGFDSLEFLISAGTIASGTATFTVLLEQSDVSDLSSGKTTVADSDTINTQTLASFTYANPNTVRRIGYIGQKRYVRLTITPASNAAAALLGAVAVLSHPTYGPVAG
jgi:hypothetical protein